MRHVKKSAIREALAEKEPEGSRRDAGETARNQAAWEAGVSARRRGDPMTAPEGLSDECATWWAQGWTDEDKGKA